MENPQKKRYLFRIYNADRTSEMLELGKRLEQMVHDCGPEDCTVEYVDILEEPERAVEQGIFLTPTLVKELPEPVRRVIGDLGDPHKTLVLMGVLIEEQRTIPDETRPPGE